MSNNKDKHLTYGISKEEIVGAGYRDLLKDIGLTIGEEITFEKLLKILVTFKFRKNVKLSLDSDLPEGIFDKRFMSLIIYKFQGFREVRTEIYFEPKTKYNGYDTILKILEVPPDFKI